LAPFSGATVTLSFLSNQTNAFLEWLRLPGDLIFIVGGVLPMLYLAWLGVRRSKPPVELERLQDISLTEAEEARLSGT
jgi:nitric oxide reductase subunit B